MASHSTKVRELIVYSDTAVKRGALTPVVLVRGLVCRF